MPCDNHITEEILLRKFPSQCRHLYPCEHSEYEIILFENSFTDNYTFSLGFKQDMEDHQNSRISVDEQTLIGQVGGILGILFGWSGMTLVEMFDYASLLLSYHL